MSTAIAIEKRVKGQSLAGIVKLDKKFDNRYVKLIVLIDEKRKSVDADRASARASKKSYKTVEDMFISEL